MGEIKAMPDCLMYRTTPNNGLTRYYRVEIDLTLFGDFSVLREWGIKGQKGQYRLCLFGNLREASTAADKWRDQAVLRGYER